MLEYILTIIWFYFPAGAANMAPVLFKWLPILNYPVDFNKKFNGQPIFGSHKTYRGFLVGILFAIAWVALQRYIYNINTSYALVDYNQINIWVLGSLMGFGALFGDLARSFVKRRLGILPGKVWFPWDQIDFVIGAIIFSYLYIRVAWSVMLLAPVLAIVLHPVFNYVGYLLRIKKNKF